MEAEKPLEPLREKSFAKGATLFREGEGSCELYVLLAGGVAVTKSGAEITRLDQKGSYFGEISALLGRPRTATVTTTESSRFLVVPPERLTDLFGQSPELGLRIAKVLATRLAATTRDLAQSKDWYTQEAGVVGT